MTSSPHPADVPAGYPIEYERKVTLRDGSVAQVRPVIPADADLIAMEAARADPETLYLRFFTPSLRIDEQRLRRLTELDYHHRFAVVAFSADGEGIGIARYEGEPGSPSAEVAVTVKPEWRRLGVAAALFAILDEAAGANGIQRLEAIYLEENTAAEQLLRACGYTAPVTEAGMITVFKHLA